jgi:HPt (histidine-containing phosphotransfer) domain-containing protein
MPLGVTSSPDRRVWAWSPRELIDRLGGDEPLARQLVALFLAEYPRLLRRLRDSVTSGRADDVRRAAHAAKGCLANFVEGGPERTAFQIEQLGAEGRLEPVAPLLIRLEHEVEALVDRMHQFEAEKPCAS